MGYKTWANCYLSCFIENQHLTNYRPTVCNTGHKQMNWKHFKSLNLHCGISLQQSCCSATGNKDPKSCCPAGAAHPQLSEVLCIKSQITFHLCSQRNFLAHGVSWNLADSLRAALTNYYYYCSSICHFVTALWWHQGTGATSSQNSVSDCGFGKPGALHRPLWERQDFFAEAIPAWVLVGNDTGNVCWWLWCWNSKGDSDSVERQQILGCDLPGRNYL